MSKIISIVIPVFNEEKHISLFVGTIGEIWQALRGKYEYEILFINDGSLDETGDVIKNLAKENPSIKYIQFSRNFGKEIATSAGLQYAQGEAAIIVDGDLQHPLEYIPEFIKKWEEGAEVVIGVRKEIDGVGIFNRFSSWVFYKIMSRIGHTEIVPQSTDFRLLDRKVINEFNRFTERNRISRGLIDWLGFKRDFVYFNASKRTYGKGTYSTSKKINLAMSAFVNHSLFPLKLAGYLGILITTVAGLLGVFILIDQYILNDPLSLAFSGTAQLATLILFLIGIVLSCLGLIALYIASIHGEVVNRPLYIIREKINIYS